jgi:glucose/mannose-6-phosphate isomerase
MLDDLKLIHERDAQDALGIAEKSWKQLLQKYDTELQAIEGLRNIIVAGMGGSGLAAQYIKSWPALAVPYEVVRDYKLPDYAGRSTLFIASSYSGNTEETVEALADAEQKKCHIVVIAAGGKLADVAKKKGYPYLQIPSGLQPRMAAFYNLAALVQVLTGLQLAPDDNAQELRKTANWLGQQVSAWRADTKTDQNLAKQVALELIGNSPVIYSSSMFYPVAYKWKINMNENAKNVAWCGTYPEFNHNEFLGWTSHPIDKPYKVVDLRSSLDHPQISKRFEISDRLLSGKRPAAYTVQLQGETLLQQLLWGTVLGDFVSIYVAILNGLNPTPVEIIERLKKELVA